MRSPKEFGIFEFTSTPWPITSTSKTSHDTLTTQVHAENPEELLHLKLHKPSTSAAGIKAVTVALQHVLKEMNLARGAKALFALNQKADLTVRVVPGPTPTMSDLPSVNTVKMEPKLWQMKPPPSV